MMDTTDLIAIIVLIVLGIFFGTLTSRLSQKREPLHGNQLAHFFHFVTCALMSIVAPTVLTLALIIHPADTEIGGIYFSRTGQTMGIALTMIVLALLSMIPFSLLEKPAKEAWEKTQVDRGWTEKDARTSGL